MTSQGASPERLGSDASATAATVLADAESRGFTGRVRFDTEVGEAEVDFVRGNIVDAYMGDLLGRSALLGLLGIAEARASVLETELEDRPPIIKNLTTLIEERDQRISRWRSLSERSPPLSAALKITPEGKESVEKEVGTETERKLLSLLDGRRTVTDLIDESGLDAIEGLGVIVELISQGLATAVTSQPSLFPLSTTVEAPRVLSDAAAPASRSPSPNRGSRRKQTVIGLGIPSPVPPAPRSDPPEAARPPEPAAPRRAEVQRIINVTTPPPPAVPQSITAPVPVPPRRRRSGSGSGSGEHAPVSVPPSEAAGRTAPRYVGRYEVLGRIGYGGMGSVYLCRLNSEVGFRRLFALKILRRHLADDEAAAKKFLEEARLAGYMHHPNVVSVVDAGFDGKQPFLVMDYVEGASLKQLLSFDPGRRPPELILPILLDALAGLHAAHTLQSDDGTPLHIVHCDISPENLLVGIDGICRLTDFGVAKHGIEGPGRREVALGKPAYMAPEQVLGARLDARTDIFAFGVMLYGALTGEKLFDGKSPEETLERVMNAPIVPPSGVGLRPPPSLDFVCMKALERDPDRRFASAEQMMIELRRIALRENLLAPTSLVADWVKQCLGPELAQRRLSVLDASRARMQALVTTGDGVRPEYASLEERIGIEPAPVDASHSRTMALSAASRTRRLATIIAAVLAATAVVITLLAPGLVSRLFRVKTAPYSVREPETGIPSAQPGSTASPIPDVQSSARPGDTPGTR